MHTKIGLMVLLGLVLALAPASRAIDDTGAWDRASLGYETGINDKPTGIGAMQSESQTVSFNIIKDHFTDMLYLASEDLDGDGNRDLVFSGWLEEAFVAYGYGDGTFEIPVQLYADRAANFAFGYVDGDTLIDILAATTSNLYFMHNNGDRTFDITAVGTLAGGMAGITTGFFNADAYLDFVVTPGTVYFGDGTGAFPSSSSLPVSDMWAADVADFDQDGDDDLAVVVPNYARLLLNDGTGNFTESASFATQQSALSVSTGNAMADFNRDGAADFAIITPLIGVDRCGSNNYWRSVISVAFGDGAGGLLGVDTMSVCGTSYNMHLADVNSDQALDVVVANASERTMEVFLADGTGWFDPPAVVSLETDSLTHALTSGDFDNDGNVDMVSGGGVISGDSLIIALNQVVDQPVLATPIAVTGYNGVAVAVTEPNQASISRTYLSAPNGRYVRRDVDGNGTLDESAKDALPRYGEYALSITTRGEAAPGQTFDAEVQVGSSTTAVLFRDYPVPATVKSGGSVVSDVIEFFYSLEEAPTISPGNGMATNGAVATFDWSDLPGFAGAEQYHFQLDGTWDFSSAELLYDDNTLTVPAFTATAPLTEGEVVYWRVASYSGAEWSEFSRTFAALVTPFMCGDANADAGGPNVLDLTYVVDYLFRNGPPPPNPLAADVDASGRLNVSDVTYLVDYLFKEGPAPQCE